MRSCSQSHRGASSSPGASSPAPISPSSRGGCSSSTCSRRRRTTRPPWSTCRSSTPPWGNASLSARSLQGETEGAGLGQDRCLWAPPPCPPITSRDERGSGPKDETLLVGRSCSTLPHVHRSCPSPAPEQEGTSKGTTLRNSLSPWPVTTGPVDDTGAVWERDAPEESGFLARIERHPKPKVHKDAHLCSLAPLVKRQDKCSQSKTAKATWSLFKN